MARKPPTVPHLLANLLPMEKVGPSLRRAARRALAEGEPVRMLPVAKAVVAELLRRGDLIRVVVEGSSAPPGALCMLREGARLVDLTVLTLPPKQSKKSTPVKKVVKTSRDATLLHTAHPSRFVNFDRVLVAMEQAQNLRIGDPLSGERDVILDNILSLLSLFLPSMQLFIMLFGERPEQWTSNRIHFTSGERPLPHWLASRAMGTEIWITSWIELPDEIKLALTKLVQETEEEPSQVSSSFGVCLAVPLMEPRWDQAVETGVSKEAGLLFALPHNEWTRDELLKVSRRLSCFVTRRWRHLRDVNQRIHNDSLTGVHNRAFFDSQFGIELERAKRDGSAMALVLSDLDHFKEVNDRYGHQAGDEVLKLVARELQRAMRRIDHVCRIGGEEFALILPNTPASAAQEVMARLLSRLARLSVRLPEMDAPINVTLSFGAVTYPDGGSDAFELYRKADSMLYLSKGTGRNRCHFWIPNSDPLIIHPDPQDN